MAQVLVNSLNVSDSCLQKVFPVLLDLSKKIMDFLHTRLQFLIDDPQSDELLQIVRLLLRFAVNGFINLGLVSKKPTEEIIKNMNGSQILQEIFNFISDFLNFNIILYFNDQKHILPLIFPIQLAASIAEFPKAESFLMEKFTKIFSRAINECKLVCYLVSITSNYEYYTEHKYMCN